MKKIVLAAAAALLSSASFAQYKYAGQWSVNAGGGWSEPRGYNIQIGTDKVFGTTSHALGIKFLYQRYKKDIGYDVPLKYDDYNLHVNYYYSFDRLIGSNVFFLNIGGGVALGYETIPKTFGPTVLVHNASQFVAGIDISAQMEFAVARSVTAFLDPRFVYLFNSDIKKGQFITGVGIKIYL